jgi:hypothetical protein
VLLGMGGLVTLILVLRFGQIAMKLGLASRGIDDLEFADGQGTRERFTKPELPKT